MIDALEFRKAVESDLPTLLALLTDDEVTRSRGYASTSVDEGVRGAFREIENDPNVAVWVAEHQGVVVAMAQLNVIAGLSRGGMKRALVEGVRVRSDLRGHGIGESFMQLLMEQSRQAGCQLIQLTSDKRRPDAHRFYERLGFIASHEGMKKPL